MTALNDVLEKDKPIGTKNKAGENFSGRLLLDDDSIYNTVHICQNSSTVHLKGADFTTCKLNLTDSDFSKQENYKSKSVDDS